MTRLQRRITPGASLLMKCQYCHLFHEWVVPAPPVRWEFVIPAYCSKQCQRNQQRAKARSLVVRQCPRMDKKLYTDEREATRIAAEQCLHYDQPFVTYICVCGGRHIGSITFKVVQR